MLNVTSPAVRRQREAKRQRDQLDAQLAGKSGTGQAHTLVADLTTRQALGSGAEAAGQYGAHIQTVATSVALDGPSYDEVRIRAAIALLEDVTSVDASRLLITLRVTAVALSRTQPTERDAQTLRELKERSK